ncbi:hypothetical protein [Mycobacterium sp. GA-2829]|nr:hypothetical protein [Mycobacterium sp. GA-2829]
MRASRSREVALARRAEGATPLVDASVDCAATHVTAAGAPSRR